MAASSDQCFRSEFFSRYCPLNPGVKPYLPGITISKDHSFVKKMDDWKIAHGGKRNDELTPPVIREHPGNPLAVIEGSDNIDYVLTDKNHGGRYFADELAQRQALSLCWDLGDGVAAQLGVHPLYFSCVIMLPTDGTQTNYRYDKSVYTNAYMRQSSAKVAKEQLPETIKGTTLHEVVNEVMNSDMVVQTIRKNIGYYELSTNDRFENLSNQKLRELLDVDANHLSGTDDISLSPLFVQKIRKTEYEPRPDGSSVTYPLFDYGFGKLFNESNILTGRVCRLTKFRKGKSVKFYRRVGLACPSFLSVGGTLALQDEDELEERDRILKDNQEYQIERMQMRGLTPYEKSKTYATGSFDLVYNTGSKDAAPKKKVAHFQLFTRTKLDHRAVLPFVLVLEMIKSELVTYLALICIIHHQMNNPHSCRFESGDVKPGDATISVYQRLVETLFPCSAWWGDGTIISGDKWKMTTKMILSRWATFLSSSEESTEEVLDVAGADERTKTKWNKIMETLRENGQFHHYLFLPVLESKSLTFTKDDRVFCTNNRKCILTENQVKKLFDHRFERTKGPLPRTVVSAVVSLGALEKPKEDFKVTRMTLDLQQPSNTLLKAETIRIFRIVSDNTGEQEPEYDVKINGYVEALRISAFKNNEVLSTSNIQEYLECLNLPENEKADVITCFEDQEATEETREFEGECEGNQKNSDREEPIAKKARLSDDN